MCPAVPSVNAAIASIRQPQRGEHPAHHEVDLDLGDRARIEQHGLVAHARDDRRVAGPQPRVQLVGADREWT